MIAIKNNKHNKHICVILATLFCFGSLFISNNFVFASEVDHIVISEVMIGLNGAPEKEFIELYNPTGESIDLSEYKLHTRNSTGKEDTSKKIDFTPNNNSNTIPAHGFFLIASSQYSDIPIVPDATYTAASDGMVANGSVYISLNDDELVDIIDTLGYGDHTTEGKDTNQKSYESYPFSRIDSNKSAERKANFNSTAETLAVGGTDEKYGNGWDSDNNSQDFVLQATPNPQNSGSSKEPSENELPENEPPIVEILSPENDSVYTEGEAINFKAETSDLEDGAIENENIIWKEGDAELGKGNEMEIKNLAVGSHTITLEVQDSGGERTTEEITIRIISAQNAEGEGEENEASDGQNNSDQESNQESETNGSQNESNQEDTTASAGGGQSGSSSAYSAPSVILPKIIITEFLPDPEDSDRDNEFIEIYNDGDAEVDLSGWIIEDKIGKTKKFTIPNSVKLKSKKYKVFYSDETGIALNNSRDSVILKDNKGNIISETPICGAAKEDVSCTLGEDGKWIWTVRPTPGRKNIIEAPPEDISVSAKKIAAETETKKKKDTSGDSNGEQEISSQETETGGGADESYDFSDSIIITEIYPNSQGRDNTDGNYEWIELYNNSDGDVNLKGWQIDDVLKKGSKPYVINEDKIIKAKGYEKLDNAETRLILNNSGDEINLVWPDGTIVDSVNYKKTTEGESYNLSSDESWFWSSETTPGAENKAENKVLGLETKTISQDARGAQSNESLAGYFENSDDNENYLGDGADYIEANIGDLKHFTKYTRVKISGIVSTPPGIFSDKSFYIYGSGIQIYSYPAQIPQLELGDYVEIIGRISEAGGEKRILLGKPEDMKIIYHLTEPKPEIISTGSIGEEVEGWLVTIEGKISEIFEDVFFVDDGSGKVKVYIKNQTGIKKPDIKIGDWMVVTGQVSQTSAGYRILPRFSRDIKISKTKETSTAATDEDSFLSYNTTKNNQGNKISAISFLFIILGLIILADWGKMKIKNREEKFSENR